MVLVRRPCSTRWSRSCALVFIGVSVCLFVSVRLSCHRVVGRYTRTVYVLRCRTSQRFNVCRLPLGHRSFLWFVSETRSYARLILSWFLLQQSVVFVAIHIGRQTFHHHNSPKEGSFFPCAGLKPEYQQMWILLLIIVDSGQATKTLQYTLSVVTDEVRFTFWNVYNWVCCCTHISTADQQGIKTYFTQISTSLVTRCQSACLFLFVL